MAGKMLTELQSINSVKYGRYADIGWLYLHTISDTIDRKPDLQKNEMLLLSAIADNSYLYSGKAMTLYKFAFDTILPDYTPMFEDVIAPKSKSVEAPQLPNIFTVYPNPTTGLVTVIIDRDDINDEMIEFLEHYGMQDIEDCENVTVSILDINGRMLQTQEFNYEDEITLNIGDYVPGAYIVEIRSCFSDVFSTKIIKM
ncbi:MAG: T9SS type A sorting domain-containing protein [Bacteroidales bacterium]|nr:T9SS type A sorting domain-containing protein [Bacteroidales bacterium]